jgi:hypothetical protein
MELEKVITLANEKVKLPFLAMERSLRATGCDLPLWVMPYDNTRFDLPPNAAWWEVPEVQQLLQEHHSHPMMTKYQCLTTANYQYVDTDVIFLRNPAEILASQEGFITSCSHWGNPEHTYTSDSLKILRGISSCWQTRVFSAGQFACDRRLYRFAELQERCLDPHYKDTCLTFPFHDQPGLVLLVNLSGVPIHNLTLPPVSMESTWAGSYEEPDYEHYWTDESRKPYLLHWSGCALADLPVNRLFTNYLTKAERLSWQQEVQERRRHVSRNRRSLKGRLRRLANASRVFAAELQK